ncbi:hypothetical protein E2C01_027017 [Portunus trituberculatus]|uniref:Uncharacterized protein n=1 Tax=Portunus trituberculatus TaxID=210409 RepID=A0A5B7EKJ1_PORTR|nr:hypothetical protein [Portunus trituberculatus]
MLRRPRRRRRHRHTISLHRASPVHTHLVITLASALTLSPTHPVRRSTAGGSAAPTLRYMPWRPAPPRPHPDKTSCWEQAPRLPTTLCRVSGTGRDICGNGEYGWVAAAGVGVGVEGEGYVESACRNARVFHPLIDEDALPISLFLETITFPGGGERRQGCVRLAGRSPS